MVIKRPLRILSAFLLPAWVTGIITAVLESGRQLFLPQRQYGLIMETFTSAVTRWTVIAILLAAAWMALRAAGKAAHVYLLSPSPSLTFTCKENRVTFFSRLSGVFFMILFAALLCLVLFKMITFNLFLGLSLAAACTALLRLKFGISLRKIFGFLRNITQKTSLIQTTALAGIAVVLLLNTVQIIRRQTISSSKPNILILVVDALRADRLGCYGYERATSPYIDLFSKDALFFESCYSTSPWTKTAVGSLFTSLYPSQHGAFFFHSRLPDKRLTLAEVFKNRGYDTLAFQTNPIITRDYNFDQGFSSYSDLTFERAEHVNAQIFSRLRKKRKPFFAYMHFMETHLPYEPPPEYYSLFETDKGPFGISGTQDAFQTRLLNELGLSDKDKRYFSNLYDGEIRYFDDRFKELIVFLKEYKLYDNTIIVLTSDHGEEFWDHGGLEHGHTLYNELLHIPLMIKPAGPPSGKIMEQPAQIVDIYPTLLHLAGLECPDSVEGVSLVSPSENEKRPLYFEGLLRGAESKGILRGGIKLIENTGVMNPYALEYIEGFKKTHSAKDMNPFELFDLSGDPGEKNNKFLAEKNAATELRALLFRYKTAVFPLGTDSQKDKSGRKQMEKTRDNLRSLGYIK